MLFFLTIIDKLLTESNATIETYTLINSKEKYPQKLTI